MPSEKADVIAHLLQNKEMRRYYAREVLYEALQLYDAYQLAHRARIVSEIGVYERLLGELILKYKDIAISNDDLPDDRVLRALKGLQGEIFLVQHGLA